MRKVSLVSFAIGAVLFGACSPNEVKLSGRLVGNENRGVYLEKLAPDKESTVDSTMTDERGDFQLRVKLADGQPTIYNLRCRGERVPLLLAPGERVKVNSLGSIGSSYTVEGSEGSQKMQELKTILSGGGARLDSILSIYTAATDPQMQREAEIAYTKEYYAVKRQHIAFVVTNPGSLAGLYALYQRLPNDPNLFAEDKDIIYYRLVADSTSKLYPNSPYVKALVRQIESADADERLANIIAEKLTQEASSYPELEMSDMYGKKHTLSSLAGKVILLDFWSAASPENRILNAELKQIYEQIADSGFEIYQVSLDENKLTWVNAVQGQALPWISVCDFKGSSSFAVMAYNVKNIPANFLIDRNGNIVEKDIYGDKLRERVKQLLKR